MLAFKDHRIDYYPQIPNMESTWLKAVPSPNWNNKALPENHVNELINMETFNIFVFMQCSNVFKFLHAH